MPRCLVSARSSFSLNHYRLLHRLEHILFNLIIQLFLGIPLEMVHGGLRVGAIYLAGVLAGKHSRCSMQP